MPPKEPRRVIVEECHRISIRQLYLKEQIRPGLITTGTLPGCSLPFRVGLSPDLERGFIQVGEQFWDIRRRAANLLHCWDDCHLFVLGRDGKPYRHLLVTRDGRVGVRGDLGAHHASTHQNSRKRWLSKRHAIICKLLITDQEPADLNRAYVPLDYHDNGDEQTKPKGMWWRTWWEKIRGYHHQQILSDIVLVPVRRPVGVTTPEFNRLLNTLNKSAIKAGRVKALSYVKARRRASRCRVSV